MVIGFTLIHSLLFGITCLQVCERHPIAHLLDRDDSRVLGKPQQARLLHIDARLCSCDVSLEGPHAGCFQGQSQTPLALAQRALALLEMGDIDDRADGKDRSQARCCVTINAASGDRDPAQCAIGASHAAFGSPMPQIRGMDRLLDLRLHAGTIVFMNDA